MKAFWEKETLFLTPNEYFQNLLKDINSAVNSIVLETYIFRLDVLGESIIAALINASRRGVSVKLLLDAIGSHEDGLAIVEVLRAEKIEVHLFRPIPWRFSSHQHAHFKGSWHEKWTHFIWRMNKRNHRKLCIIDDHIAWVGSFNITQDHFGLAGNNWKDLGVRVKGKHVDSLKHSFEQIWRRTQTHQRLHRFKYFFSNHTRKLRLEKNQALIQLIEKAQTRVWITNAYFSPSQTFLKALYAANKRGVSVKILVPEKSDIFFFPALTSTYYLDLLKAKIHVYEYHEKILHEKSMLIDQLAIIGSTNLNYRSFFHDLELDLLLNQPKTIAAMEQKFTNDLIYSQEVTPKKIHNQTVIFSLMGWLSRFLRYWL